MPTRKVHANVTLEAVMDQVESDDYLGFCLVCGEEAYGVEPDASEYKCETCGEPYIFGAEEILLMHLTAGCSLPRKVRGGDVKRHN